MSKADLTYACHDGFWISFYPETANGIAAFQTMAESMPDGVVKFNPIELPGVLAQLRAAGYSVRIARPTKGASQAGLDDIAAALAELE